MMVNEKFAVQNIPMLQEHLAAAGLNKPVLTLPDNLSDHVKDRMIGNGFNSACCGSFMGCAFACLQRKHD
jgi:hypothetical protein